MTQETKLKKGDRVVMHTCIEAETHNGRIWTCSSDQFTRGTGALAQDSIFLEGFSGSFAPEFLQKVTLPAEDERLLAALEEAEQELKRDREWTEYWHEKELKVRMQLAEAQQTIARQREAIKWYELGKPELAWAALGEGSKESTKTEPHSCGEGGECSCIDCGGTNSRTWVCEECQKKREAKGHL